MKTDKKIINYQRLYWITKKHHSRQQTIALTTGCYDILHLGHVLHFQYCKSKADILVVSVGNDRTVMDLKGPTRPINNEIFRARMLAALEIVDYVVISQEQGNLDHTELIQKLRPDVYIVPVTDTSLDKKKKLVESVGTKFVTSRRLPPNHTKGGISTTIIEERLSS